MAGPCVGPLARERVENFDAVVTIQLVELAPINDVARRARGVEQASGRVAQSRLRAGGGCSAAARFRIRRRAGAAGRRASAPHEISADRTAQLELVADAHLADDVRRDLATLYSLDGQHQRSSPGRRRYRVAALRLITVFGGESHVDVLAREMTWPARAVEHDASYARRLVDD